MRKLGNIIERKGDILPLVGVSEAMPVSDDGSSKWISCQSVVETVDGVLSINICVRQKI